MNTKRAVGVFAGRALVAFVVFAVACLPRDDLSTHSQSWGIDASGGGGGAGAPAGDALPADAGNDSSAAVSGGGAGGSTSAPELDAAAGDSPQPDASGDAGGTSDAAGDAATSVLDLSDAGG